jgi:Na+/H+-translocating membrane pyrophosphatase
VEEPLWDLVLQVWPFRFDLFLYLLLPFFMNGVWTTNEDMTIVLETLTGFSLGRNLLLCFRVGGGIYEKRPM